MTPSVSSKRTSNASGDGQGLATGTPAACTPACTDGGAVENLAAAFLALSAEERNRLLAALLMAGPK